MTFCLFIRLSIVVSGVFILLSFIIECSCMPLPLTPTMIIISALTFHSLCIRVSISGSHLLRLVSMAISHAVCKFHWLYCICGGWTPLGVKGVGVVVQSFYYA